MKQALGALLAVVLGIAAIFAVVVVVYLIAWVWAPWQGKLETHQINQSAPNRIVQQASFEQEYADVEAYALKLKDAKSALAEWDATNGTRPDNTIGSLAAQRLYLVQVRDGLAQQCQNTVANYNADTHKTLAKDWKDARLPYELDASTACK